MGDLSLCLQWSFKVCEPCRISGYVFLRKYDPKHDQINTEVLNVHNEDLIEHFGQNDYT